MTFYIDYPQKISNYGMNAIYSGKHWTKRKKDAEYWHILTINALRQQGIKRNVLDYPVKVVLSWNDRLDIDNHSYMGKMIVDSLKGYIIKDDNRKYLKEITHRFWNGKQIK
jgi:Endodeoxyribonuclease RusA.